MFNMFHNEVLLLHVYDKRYLCDSNLRVIFIAVQC